MALPYRTEIYLLILVAPQEDRGQRIHRRQVATPWRIPAGDMARVTTMVVIQHSSSSPRTGCCPPEPPLPCMLSSKNSVQCHLGSFCKTQLATWYCGLSLSVTPACSVGEANSSRSTATLDLLPLIVCVIVLSPLYCAHSTLVTLLDSL